MPCLTSTGEIVEVQSKPGATEASRLEEDPGSILPASIVTTRCASTQKSTIYCGTVSVIAVCPIEPSIDGLVEIISIRTQLAEEIVMLNKLQGECHQARGNIAKLLQRA